MQLGPENARGLRRRRAEPGGSQSGRAVMKGERVHCARRQETLAHVSEAVSCGKETPWNAEVTSVILPVLGGQRWRAPVGLSQSP